VTEGADTLAHDAMPDGGMMLRSAREAAGLSVAAVAQQLKLAPRQVVALEEGDVSALPGRTFVRGFARNYARLLRLDSEAVLAALPDSAAPSSLEHPSLAPSPRPMGELPRDTQTRSSAARWAIPLALVAVVSVAAVYEISRPPPEPAQTTVAQKADPEKAAPSLNAAAPVAVAPPPESVPGNTTTALPNPLAGEPKPDTAPETAAGASNAAVAAAPSPEVSATAIALSFQGKSWVEVRDGTGALILQVTGNAGDKQAIGGRPPFDVIIGNAAAVTVNWQGKPIDVAPFTRQNVARFTLR
jgi:cytoskeleton protein RodZ